MEEKSLAKERLGILGGSGLYSISGLKDIEEINVDTPFGSPSDTLLIGKLNNMDVVFLARHGKGHTLLPTEVPYKANIWAMKFLGVKWIISASAVGSLKEEIKPLDMVIPDQFIDRTHQRPISFFGEGLVGHVSMASPFCNNLSNIMAETAKIVMPNDRKLHTDGTYLCMEGPAFSTKAESILYRSWGCSIIGMTNHSEARLAKEAEIAYSTLAMSTDYDCWHEDHDDVTVEMIVANLQKNAELANKIISAMCLKIDQIRPVSDSHNALKDALITQKDKVPVDTRNKLQLIIEKYW